MCCDYYSMIKKPIGSAFRITVSVLAPTQIVYEVFVLANFGVKGIKRPSLYESERALICGNLVKM